eukprot:TRINITY_DN3862_c1_g1_i1.p5 TRINITY_DN3862_c1_g1~~TRINITY_DN3862_c1_g1_i1.p5  ORF type:complete len:115 (+),score=3.04 TRINITY_DN3862_c1_g1_i1:798-1142(+)
MRQLMSAEHRDKLIKACKGAVPEDACSRFFTEAMRRADIEITKRSQRSAQKTYGKLAKLEFGPVYCTSTSESYTKQRRISMDANQPTNHFTQTSLQIASDITNKFEHHHRALHT